MLTENSLKKSLELKFFLALLCINIVVGLVIVFYPSKEFTAAKPIYSQETPSKPNIPILPEPNIPILSRYIAGTNKKFFHRMDCKMVEELTSAIIFETREEAIEAGKYPCPLCEP